MSYLAQINRSIDYIESHLREPLTLEDLAKEAGMSKWHFQRSFRAMVGDTVKEYVSKRRLSLAATELLNPDAKIIEVAVKYEFDSHEVFTRAFKRLFSVTPSAFRSSRSPHSVIPQKPKITLAYLTHLYGGVSMEPVIKQLQEMAVLGVPGEIKSVNDSQFDGNQEIIPKLWMKLRESIGELNPENQNQKIGVINCSGDVEQDSTLEYLAGVVIKTDEMAPKGLEKRIVPAGEYAEFTHRGPMKNIGHTINYIYGSWLPKSGRRRSEGPEVSLYPEAFDSTSEEAEVKVLIPLM